MGWISSNEGIAKVKSIKGDGKEAEIIGVSGGTVTITATAGGKSATCTVKVETWETITFNSPANVNRVKRYSSPTGTSSADFGYHSTYGALYQWTTQPDHVANPYLDGLSSTSIEFVAGSFGEPRDPVTGMIYSYSYFTVKLNSGRIIYFYFRASSDPGWSGVDRSNEFWGGSTSKGQIVVTDSVLYPAPGCFQAGPMLPKDAYHKFNVVIENNILKIKTNDSTRYSVNVPEGSLISYWEFAGTAAYYNAGSQDGRIKYITYNTVF